MKRILLPTDFSENAYNAIRYAVKLLKDDLCEFYVVHTYTPVMVSSGSMLDSYSAMTLQKAFQDSVQVQLDALESSISKEFTNDKHTFSFKASFNILISEMKLLIKKHDIDFVIMGTQGASGAKEVFIGTQTMYAIKKLKCPVLAVPSNFSYEAPKEILFPTDFKLNPNNKYLPMLRELCDQHISRINILNAYFGTPLSEKQQENKAFLDSYFGANAHLFHITEGTDVPGAVAQFQIKNKINFMVMIHNKHNFLENMLFKPVINQLVFHTGIPFLVIPAVERQ